MFWRKKHIWAALEATYGTDATPTDADTVLTKNLNIDPYRGDLVTRDLDRDTLGAQTAINTGPNVEVTFDVELVGSGVVDSAPPGWGTLLQACGFAETVTVTTGPVEYDPISTFGTLTAASIYFALDGQQHIILGARGTVSINLERGSIPSLSFRFLGFYQRPTATAMTRTVSAYLAPIPVTNANTSALDFGAYTTGRYESLTIDLQNELVYRNVINGEEVFIVDRNPTIQAVVEAEPVGTKDWFADVESDSGITTQALNLVHDTGAGRQITITGPAVQFQTIAPGESDGLAVYNLSGVMVPNTGDDEVKISIN